MFGSKLLLNTTIAVLVAIVLSGCSVKTTLKPLVNDCCLDKNLTIIDKKIYIGHFEVLNNDNKKGIFGNKNFYNSDKVENINFKENINLIIREELKRRLSKHYKSVVLVDAKPKNINEDNIYIAGKLNNLWVNQKYVNLHVKKFNFTNQYKLNIESIVNNKPIKNNFNAKLLLKSDIVNKKSNGSGVAMAILFNFAALDEALTGDVGQSISHKLYINNKLLSDIFYYQFLESGVGRFTTDYNVVIQANIKGKNPIKIEDSDKGNVNKFELFDMPYSYLSPNLNTSPGYNYIGNDTFDLYLSKNDILKINKNKVIDQKEYDDCIVANGMMSNECTQPNSRNLKNTKYYDIFRQYATTSGILQYMINEHIDNIIEKIK